MIRTCSMQLLLALVTAVALTSARAVEPVPISANAAFDAVQTQKDPLSGYPANVVLVDLRSRAEYNFIGTPAKVDAIVLKGKKVKPIVPDLGKVRLIKAGKFIEYRVGGNYRRTLVSQVSTLQTSPIAINIPCALWDETAQALVANTVEFQSGIADLASQGVQVLIAFCTSGGRSTQCIANLPESISRQFQAIYEIDDPSGKSAYVGGFKGSDYGGVYNGYQGFPGRLTGVQAAPSVSWEDRGLPIFVPDPVCLVPE